jgi:hypothetical protein
MTCDPDSGTGNDPVTLDAYRGMAAQKATDLRRLVSEVEAQRAALASRQQELEKHLFAGPAENWDGAVDKARYLLALFAATSAAEDPRRRKLIANVLADFDRLLAEHPINAFVGANDE